MTCVSLRATAATCHSTLLPPMTQRSSLLLFGFFLFLIAKRFPNSTNMSTVKTQFA